MQYCFAKAFPKKKIICPRIKWAYYAKNLHNESDLKDFKREAMTMQEVLSKVLGKQQGQKELIPLISSSLHEWDVLD